MARNYVLLPHAYLSEMRLLTDKEFGRLCRALLQFSITGEEVQLKGNERLFQIRVYNLERRFQKSYEETVERNRSAGRKGAAARWRKIADDSQIEI